MNDMTATQQIEVTEREAQESQIRSKRIKRIIEDAETTRKECTPEAHAAVVDLGLLGVELTSLAHADIKDMKTGVNELKVLVTTRNGHPLCFKRGPLREVPIKYAFYAAMAALCLAAGIIMFALTHDKLSDLADAVSIVRGTATRTNAMHVASHKPNE
jgi:hypothetical protein